MLLSLFLSLTACGLSFWNTRVPSHTDPSLADDDVPRSSRLHFHWKSTLPVHLLGVSQSLLVFFSFSQSLSAPFSPPNCHISGQFTSIRYHHEEKGPVSESTAVAAFFVSTMAMIAQSWVRNAAKWLTPTIQRCRSIGRRNNCNNLITFIAEWHNTQDCLIATSSTYSKVLYKLYKWKRKKRERKTRKGAEQKTFVSFLNALASSGCSLL